MLQHLRLVLAFYSPLWFTISDTWGDNTSVSCKKILVRQVYLRHLFILDKDETKKEEIKVEITNTGTCAIHTYIRKFLCHRLPLFIPRSIFIYMYIPILMDCKYVIMFKCCGTRIFPAFGHNDII